MYVLSKDGVANGVAYKDELKDAMQVAREMEAA